MFIGTKQFEETVNDLQKRITILEESNDQLISTVQVLNDIREKKLSDEPWVEVLGGDIDPEKGLQLKLDWNDAFIDQLRAQGFKGTSESSLIGEYLLQLSQMMAENEE